MNFLSIFFCFFVLITPISTFAQIDTLKLGFGINSLQFGVAQPSDVIAYYSKKHPKLRNSKNPRYKEIKIKGIAFLFAKYDSTFILELIKIQPTHNKFYIKEGLTFSSKTKIKDITLAFDTVRVLRSYKPNSLVQQYKILGTDHFNFHLSPKTVDLMQKDRLLPLKDLLGKYTTSKIHHLSFYCNTCKFPPAPPAEKRKRNLQLFYTRQNHLGYYKNQDSLVLISANYGCIECNHLPFFKVHYYTKKKRPKTVYFFSGFAPIINQENKPSKTLRQLKKGAYQKKEFFYFGKHKYIIKWERKSLRALYYIAEIEHVVS